MIALAGHHEHRAAERYAILCRARVFGPHFPEGLTCVVKNVSDTGCMIVGPRVDYVGHVGDQFRMKAEDLNANESFHCEVRWRSKNTIGVKFV